MSKTISFVASDELAELLEREAEKRMTTVSSTAQMLLAEKAREMGEFSEDRPEKSGAEEGSEGGGGGVFDEYPEMWHHPDSEKHNFAVQVPEDSGTHDQGRIRYFKTRDGAGEALRRWYE